MDIAQWSVPIELVIWTIDLVRLPATITWPSAITYGSDMLLELGGWKRLIVSVDSIIRSRMATRYDRRLRRTSFKVSCNRGRTHFTIIMIVIIVAHFRLICRLLSVSYRKWKISDRRRHPPTLFLRLLDASGSGACFLYNDWRSGGVTVVAQVCRNKKHDAKTSSSNPSNMNRVKRTRK